MKFPHQLIIVFILPSLIISQTPTSVSHLCSLDKLIVKYKTINENIIPTNDNFCDCTVINTSPWGLPALVIQCHDMLFDNSFFEAEVLPYGTEKLDLSWNNFQHVPDLIGDQLKILELSNNKIKTIDDNNFDKIQYLRELDLSRNKIEEISINAFSELHLLQKLDLSRNRIKTIFHNVFSPLPALTHLILSENNLKKAFTEDSGDLFISLGVTPNLLKLELKSCQLNQIDLLQGTGLEEVDLSNNNFSSPIDLARGIEKLDLSGNPIKALKANFLPHLFKLSHLYLRDMPNLASVDEFSLFGLPKLIELNFEGSRNLTSFDEYAFGTSANLNETEIILEILNLRGTSLKTLNSTLLSAFQNIKVLNLEGNPILCNCDIQWVQDLLIETGGQCLRPKSLRGTLLTNVPKARFECKKWTHWFYSLMNGLLVFLLLILCGVAIWLIVVGIKPSRRKNLQKVGASSPYARITIEPNRAENHF